MVIMDRQMFIDYLNKLDSKERAIVTRTNGLKSYGFSDVFEQDGVEISTEYAVPAGTGYGLSISNMELRCMEGSLMTSEGPFYNEDTQAYRYVVSVLANLKFKSPRNFFKLQAIA
jgi:pantoate kinase